MAAAARHAGSTHALREHAPEPGTPGGVPRGPGSQPRNDFPAAPTLHRRRNRRIAHYCGFSAAASSEANAAAALAHSRTARGRPFISSAAKRTPPSSRAPRSAPFWRVPVVAVSSACLAISAPPGPGQVLRSVFGNDARAWMSCSRITSDQFPAGSAKATRNRDDRSTMVTIPARARKEGPLILHRVQRIGLFRSRCREATTASQ